MRSQILLDLKKDKGSALVMGNGGALISFERRKRLKQLNYSRGASVSTRRRALNELNLLKHNLQTRFHHAVTKHMNDDKIKS